MKRNQVYYDLLTNTAFRTMYVGFEQVNVKEIKANTGRAKMGETTQVKKPQELGGDNILLISDPKKILHEVRNFKQINITARHKKYFHPNF